MRDKALSVSVLEVCQEWNNDFYTTQQEELNGTLLPVSDTDFTFAHFYICVEIL